MLRIGAVALSTVIAVIAVGLTAPASAGPDEIEADAKAEAKADVEALQWRLLFLGYDVGRTDGVARPKTRAAIRAFERDQGLSETGEPTEALLFLTSQEWERRRRAEWETLRD